MKILIHNRAQYGLHTDTQKYLEILGPHMEIEYVCLDASREKQFPALGEVTYACSPNDFKFLRAFKLISYTLRNYKKFDHVFVVYHPGVSLLGLALRGNATLDIRSRVIGKNRVGHILGNYLLRIESKFFKNASVVSKELGKYLRLKDPLILPVGTDIQRLTDHFPNSRIDDRIVFLYLGSLEQHEIHSLVEGFAIAKNEDNQKVFLRLVGSGPQSEITKIQEAIRENHLEESVEMLGHQFRDKIPEIMSNADIGVVHIPTDGRYDGQPSTKLFEYWSFGLPVIASNYDMNKQLVFSDTGFLYEMNPADIARTISAIIERLPMYDRSLIAKKALDHSWDNIVLTQLKPYLERKSKVKPKKRN